MASVNDIQNLYIAYFNRPADVAGLAYWSQTNLAAVQIAQSFSKQVEYASIYANFSTKQTVNALFNNLFNHDADSAGLAYWIGQIENGTFTIGQAAIAILAGATGPDAACVTAKLVAANGFTSKMAASTSLQATYSQANGNAFDLAKIWLAGVTDAASATAAAAKVNATFTAMPDPATLSITVKRGVENLGTSGNNTFLATNDVLLTSGTTIKGNGGTDVLTVTNYAGNVVHPAIVTGVTTLNLHGGDLQIVSPDPFLNQFSIINDYKTSDSIRLGNIPQTLNLYVSDMAGVTLGAPNQVVRQLTKSGDYVYISSTHANLEGAVISLEHTIKGTSIDRTIGPFGNKLIITDAGNATLGAAMLKNFTWVALSAAENLTISPDTALMISVADANTTITETSGAGDVAIYMDNSRSLTLNTSATHATELNLLGHGTNAVTLTGAGNVVISAAQLGNLNLTGSAGLETILLPTFSNAIYNIAVASSTIGNMASKLITVDNLKSGNGKAVLHTGARPTSMETINIATADFNSLAGNIASSAGKLSDHDYKAFVVKVASGAAAGTYVYEHFNGTTVDNGDIIVKLTGNNYSVNFFDLQA
ncbi:DUF4214 domain-containing protein [Undibacterium pigrum]|uniref:Uncharacterized protein DUF4214 n=1 Tax=Undibacterium pigrum TaxID=401470 RepID=A0A318J598_9BURK|nr:DUF4214 domain-containing protein [Undibacterium pigrum]PXX41517.1 uncharacterized protein DUF4214 [Undibacterium pigrum]